MAAPSGPSPNNVISAIFSGISIVLNIKFDIKTIKPRLKASFRRPVDTNCESYGRIVALM